MGGLLDLEVFQDQFPDIKASYKTDTDNAAVNASNTRLNSQNSLYQGMYFPGIVDFSCHLTLLQRYLCRLV